MVSVEQSNAIAAIVGVAGAGFRLSLILNAVSCEVASEGLEVHSISKTVTLFSLALKQTGTSLQAYDSVHTYDALDGVQKISEDATKVFEEFNDMLDRVRTKPADGTTAPPSIHQRFQWCFKRHRVTYLLAQLDSFKLSLSVIQQVLQLGKLMASTSKHDSQEEVVMKKELIQQERLETQNALIVRYWQLSKLDRLFESSRREDEDARIATLENNDDDLTLVSSAGSSQLTIEAAPAEYTTSMALVKIQTYSLGELDQTLHKIKQSPKDMVQVSNDAIDPLLERWTRWYEVRERKHTRDSGSRYGPSVDTYYEDEEERPYHQRYRGERSDSPQGYYLEGTTTDWRKPHSVEARSEAKKRRQQYSRYQPSVSAASSDLDDSPGSTHSKKRSPRHHVIDSASESSDSEHDQPRVRLRRGSASPTTERKATYSEGPPIAHSYSAGQAVPRKPPTPGHQVNIGSRLAPSPQIHRPQATPDQNAAAHHSLSLPVPPIHTANAPNPYAPTNAPYPSYGPYYPPGPQQPMSSAHARYLPQRPPLGPLGNNARPISRDGTTGNRSPSRGSWANQSHPGQAPASRSTYPKPTLEEEKEKRAKTRKNLREGATKGLLGAGAIAGFLEALEGLSI